MVNPTHSVMRAVYANRGEVMLRHDVPLPDVRPGWARVKVSLAGICGTDLELLRGYAGFSGVIGHEFVGTVDAAEKFPTGARVVADISIGCGECEWCRRGSGKHCRNRRVLGIRGVDGACADFVTVPERNLLPVPQELTDEQAVFAEPLAAAFHAVALVPELKQPLLVVGAGRLGILVALAAVSVGHEVMLASRSSHVRSWLNRPGIAQVPVTAIPAKSVAVAVDCTGSPAGIESTLGRLAPRGRLIVKSTWAGKPCKLSGDLVVDELEIVGSRCGDLSRALDQMRAGCVDPRPLIDGRFDLADANKAFDMAGHPGILKVLLDCGTNG